MSIADEEGVIGYKTITVQYTEWGEWKSYADFAVAFGYRLLTDIAPELEAIWANGSLIWTPAGGAVNFTFMSGSEDQMPLPGSQIGYRGLIYLNFPHFCVDDYGRSIPRIEVQLKDQEELTLATLMTGVALRGGYPEDAIDVAHLEAPPVYGFIIGANTTVANIASTVGTLYNFQMLDLNGSIAFISNYDEDGNAIIDVDVAPDDLAQLQEGSDQAVDVMRRSDDSLPLSIGVRFTDPDIDFDTNYLTASRNTYPVPTMAAVSALNLELPLIVPGAEMRERLFEALYRSWETKNGMSVRLPPSLLRVLPGDVITVSAYGVTYTAQVARGVINADWSLSASLVEVAPERQSTVVATQPPIRPVQSPLTPKTDVLMLDLPDWSEDQETDDALNLRVMVTPGEGFAPTRVDMAPQSESNAWHPVAYFPEPTPVARLIAPPAPIANPFVVDPQELVLALGTIPPDRFEDATLAELEDGANLLVIGRELVQFTTALVEDDQVTLSGLYRGRFGTENYVNSHVADEVAVFAEDLKKVQYPVSQFREFESYLYRAVTPKVSVSEVEVRLIAPTGNSRKPRGPIDVKARRQENGDLKLTWTRRSRFNGDYLSGVGGELDESLERYNVEIYSDGWESFKRRYTGGTKTEFLYYIEEQIQDGVNADDKLHALVYQINPEKVGQGEPGGGALNIIELALELAGNIAIDVDFAGEPEWSGDTSQPIELSGNIDIGVTFGGEPDVSEAPSPPAYGKFWRILFNAGAADQGFVQLNQLNLLLDDEDVSSIGAAPVGTLYHSSSNYPGPYFVEQAFDGNNANYWLNDNAIGFPHWVEVEYPEGQAVNGIQMALNQTNRAPFIWEVRRSDDGFVYETVYRGYSVTGWTGNVMRTWYFDDADTENHDWRAWRIRVTAPGPVGLTGMDWSEVEWLQYDNQDLVDLHNGSVNFSASSSYTPDGLTPEKAFDNNAGTRWASDFSGTWPQSLVSDFGPSTRVRPVAVSIQPAFSRSPGTFYVDVSDNLTDWHEVAMFTQGTFSGRTVFYFDSPENDDSEWTPPVVRSVPTIYTSQSGEAPNTLGLPRTNYTWLDPQGFGSPYELQAGDLAVAFFHSKAVAGAITPPSGDWTLLGSEVGPTGTRVHLFTAPIGGFDDVPTGDFVTENSSYAHLQVMVIRGLDPVTPILGHGGISTTSATPALPGGAGSESAYLYLTGITGEWGTYNYTPPAGFTETYDVNHSRNAQDAASSAGAKMERSGAFPVGSFGAVGMGHSVYSVAFQGPVT